MIDRLVLLEAVSWDSNMIEIFKIINCDYAHITLEQLAKDLNYNKNYLSNYIKNKTGKTFRDLVTLIRLQEAYCYILLTKLPVEAVSEYVGFSNKTQFYKKFTELFQKTPGQVRQG